MCKNGYAMKADDKSCKIYPENCNSCEYDAAVSDTKCLSGQCKSGYAQKDDNRFSCLQCQVCSSCTYNSANPSVADCNPNSCPSKQQVQNSDKQCGSM